MEPGEDPRPTLLCDEVGVGKTFQLIGLISMLAHIIELQRADKALPPLLEESHKKYFAGKEKIELLPILIAVPRTLSSQWVAELKKFTEKGAFSILLYSRSTAGQFFAKDSDYSRACAMKDKNGNSIAHRIIIVAEMTALGREAKLRLTRHARDAHQVVMGTPEELCDTETSSLLGLQVLLTIIDKTHLLRNPQETYQAVLRALCNSRVRVAATATPVFTGAKDPIAEGRLLHYPPVIGEAGLVLNDRMQSSERRRRKEWASDDEVQERFVLEVLKMMSAVRGGKEESAGKDTSTSTRAVVEDDKFMKNFYVSKEAIAMSKAAVFPIIIRRTKRLKQLDGQKIINLKPFTESIVWVNLTAEEMAAIEMIGAKFQGDNTNVVCTNFLIEFKKISLHLGLGQHGDRFWESWTVETLAAVILSKVRAVMDVVEHHQNPVAGPMIWRHEDRQRDLAAEAEAAIDFHPASRPRKFLILAVYECHRAILKKVTVAGSGHCRQYADRAHDRYSTSSLGLTANTRAP
ncbi:hypothetical protein FS749_014652 [Ceratobasidium sp. UAMH 11750]|nr:hypothetical protein FS749_014652 [Ceratobasidium sp. UAMH 11750]